RRLRMLLWPQPVILGEAVMRFRGRGALAIMLLLISAAMGPAANPETPAAAAAPAAPAPGSPANPGETTPPARVEGFRSALWGMTDAQVKAAIHKDFNIAADKIRSEENLAERTHVLSVLVPDLLEGAGTA